MSNSFFRFQQFVINQDKCAMKVCTDACLFGAWVANMLFLKQLSASTILDAGSGTGLLSLMLAQKSAAEIDAIEIDKNSFEQSLENIQSSRFNNSIKVYQGDFLNFKYDHKYDLVVCNPPFFIDQLKSAGFDKSNAMHNNTENFKQLFSFAKNHISPGGNFAILISHKDLDKAIVWAEQCALYPAHIAQIQHSPAHAFLRVFILFGEIKLDPVLENISINNAENKYDEIFIKLLADYYL
ncbi:MAG: methyltransferase [Ginsengibacter sp.]